MSSVAEKSQEKPACAVEMCIFVADVYSKYCKHHRSSMEAYDEKLRVKAERLRKA